MIVAWTIFKNPVVLPFSAHLWFLLPLCIAVSVVYKTIRTHDLRHLPREIGVLVAYMLIGLTIMGVGLWLLHEHWP